MVKGITLSKTLIVLLFGWGSSPFHGFSQTIPDFKTQLNKSRTAEEFSRHFQDMMTVFHKGELNFKDQDVVDIVSYAQGKSFATNILPVVYGWAGTMYGDGRMQEAVVYFMESASLYAKQGKQRSEALCYFQIALVQHKAENYVEAGEYYTKALDTALDSLDTRIVINCYNGLALIKREAGDLDVAEKDFRSAYHTAIKNNDQAWIAILLGNIGSIHLRKKEFDSALYYYQRNLQIVRTTTEIENEIETYAHIAKVYLGKNKPKQTLLYLDSAMRMVNTRKILFNDFFNPTDYINESYALAWSSLGDYKKAFDYYAKFHAVAQEKQERVNSKSLRQLQLTLSNDQKQSELELLQKVNQANVGTIRQQRYLEGAFIFIIALVSVFAVITYLTGRQRKKLNKELAITNSELERLNKLKNKLFSVISHDLRTPLGNLQSILSLYQSGDLEPQDVATIAAKLGHQVKASGHVLENLLEWAKSELNEVKINPGIVLVNPLVDRVIHQFEADLKSKMITATNEVANDIVVWADQNQVEIVIRNLFANAVKFTGENGSIKIAANSLSTTVQIVVQDTGVGMTTDQVSKLFSAERVVTTAGTNKEKGSGIGLLITRELLTNNNGQIDVQSSKEHGTTFTITLPTKK